jgi:hypothetical protein
MREILNQLATLALATIVVTLFALFMGWAQSRGQ